MKQKRTLISLFAGAGGLDLGLEQAGFVTKVAIDVEHQACETLKQNKKLCNLTGLETDGFIRNALKQKCFNRLNRVNKELFFERIRKSKHKEKYLQEAEIIEGDIRKIASIDLLAKLKNEPLFCIAGGPPCQPFSKAGRQKSLDCTKNGDLFFEFVRLVNDLQPSWFVFENVKGITFTKTDVVYQVCQLCRSKNIAPFEIRQSFEHDKSIIPCLKCRGAKTRWIVKNEAGGSLKIIIHEFEKIGYKCQNRVLNAADFGVPQIRERLFIVGNRHNKDFEWPKPTHQKLKTQNHQLEIFANRNLKPWKSMSDILWSEIHPIYGKFDRTEAKLWVKNVVRPHDEPVTWSLDRPSPTIGAHQSAKLAFAPNGVSEQQLYRQQWATKGRKQGDTPPVFVEHQYLSDEELLKLQTFPAWWYLHGTRMQRAFQIGNAVPPLLARAIGKAILSAENKMKSKTLSVFSLGELKVATDLLSAKVSTMLGRKMEEDDWSFVYCNAKNIPYSDWSNLYIDVNYNGLGVEHKMLKITKSGSILNECGTTKMHPAGTRSIRIPDESDPNKAMVNILSQYNELVDNRTDAVLEKSDRKVADMRVGWLLWKDRLDEFLYFEEAMTKPNPSEFYAKWNKTPARGARKASKSLWIYEKSTGKKKYSVTTTAGAKIQPYFDIPAPNDENLYHFKVQGVSIDGGLVKVWVTRSTAKYLELLVGSLESDKLSNAIDTLSVSKEQEQDTVVTAEKIATPLFIKESSYKKLQEIFPSKSDEYIFQQFAIHLGEKS